MKVKDLLLLLGSFCLLLISASGIVLIKHFELAFFYNFIPIFGICLSFLIIFIPLLSKNDNNLKKEIKSKISEEINLVITELELVKTKLNTLNDNFVNNNPNEVYGKIHNEILQISKEANNLRTIINSRTEMLKKQLEALDDKVGELDFSLINVAEKVDDKSYYDGINNQLEQLKLNCSSQASQLSGHSKNTLEALQNLVNKISLIESDFKATQSSQMKYFETNFKKQNSSILVLHDKVGRMTLINQQNISDLSLGSTSESKEIALENDEEDQESGIDTSSIKSSLEDEISSKLQSQKLEDINLGNDFETLVF